MAIARYEYSEGSSNKFWQIELSGSSFTTTHGKIGTGGSTLVKSWPDEATAKKEHDKLVAQKTKKGYALVSTGAPAKGAAKPAKADAKAGAKAGAKAEAKAAPKGKSKAATAPAGAGGSSNPALAKVIEADPDDAGAWAVYADWLQSQGDPRGELGIVQERLRAQPKDKTLVSAEKKLLKDHAAQLIGEFAMYLTREGKPDIPGVLTKPDLEPDFRETNDTMAPVRVQWRSGFFSQVFVGHPGYDWSPAKKRGKGGDDDGDGEGGEGGGGEVSASKLVLDVLASPAARFLSSLRLGMPNSGDDGECDYSKLIKQLTGHEALGRLRSLYIGDVTQEESECSWISIGDISKLYPSLKNLRSLTLRGGNGLKLGSIALPELRELTIITGGLDKKNLAAICAARWPKLEKLELWLGQKEYGGNVTAKDLAALLGSKAFPKLKHLGLRNSELADELAALLPRSSLMKQIETLDLSKGTLTDTGVQALADGKDSLAHLRRIDLSDNYIGKASVLASTIVKVVRTRPQRTADDYGDGEVHRYTALGE